LKRENPDAEDALIKSREQFNSLVNNIEGIVWEADAQTFKFTFVSNQAEVLLGYPARQWISEPTFWKDHLHPDDRDWAVAYCVDYTLKKKRTNLSTG
jgi:PAS domain-containing protein